MVKLSIIIPNYNNEKYIESCINSIYNQSFKDYEIIVVDDGSNDASIKIIEEITKKKRNIILIKQYNQNAAIARNRGIELAKGEYVLFLDGDDYLYDKDSLLYMIRKIKNNDLLMSNYKRVSENGTFLKNYIIKKDISKNHSSIIDKYAFASALPTNKLYRLKTIREKNIYFDNVDIGQDLNFYLKYLGVCNKVAIIDKYSYCYRVNNNGMTRTINYNLLDIVKSIDYVKKFYKNHDIKDDGAIDAVAFLNYISQMNKLTKVKHKKEKKFIYNYFNYFIKRLSIKKKYIKTNAVLSRSIKRYKIKQIAKPIYLSNFYGKLTNK